MTSAATGTGAKTQTADFYQGTLHGPPERAQATARPR